MFEDNKYLSLEGKHLYSHNYLFLADREIRELHIKEMSTSLYTQIIGLAWKSLKHHIDAFVFYHYLDTYVSGPPFHFRERIAVAVKVFKFHPQPVHL